MIRGCTLMYRTVLASPNIRPLMMASRKRTRPALAFLLRLYIEGNRNCGALAFSTGRTWSRAPLAVSSHSLAMESKGSTSWPAMRCYAVRTQALGAAVEALAEPVENVESSSESAPSLHKTVVVVRGKARLFREGNPLVYSGAVSMVNGNPIAGDVVDVVDSSGKLIAWGVYNPHSMYRVRILAKDGEAAAERRDVGAVVRERLKTARAARQAIGIPNEDTDTYRLINGEGDRLSGLVVDVFAGVVGVSSSAVWVETFRSEIEAALEEEFHTEATEIIWRRSAGHLQQDGWKGNDVVTAAVETGKDVESMEDGDAKQSIAVGYAEGAGVRDEEKEVGAGGGGDKTVEERKAFREAMPTTVVRELGLEYEIRPQLGQKTGFYCDQRESREAVRKFSSGKSVLDMFCYSGGFALNAAAGGASSVVAVDSSQPALDEAQINAARNGLEGKTKFVKDDALKFMKTAATNGDRYDMVVLDPPKLAPNKKALPRAISRYKRLNTAALKLVAPGGLLVTFTCSAAMTQSGNFVGIVQAAAAAAGRTVTLMRTVGPAADHVINPCYPEGAYLTGALFYVV